MTESDPGADAGPATPLDEERRAHARQRLEDAGAHVTAESRTESREQVREIMGWS